MLMSELFIIICPNYLMLMSELFIIICPNFLILLSELFIVLLSMSHGMGLVEIKLTDTHKRRQAVLLPY